VLKQPAYREYFGRHQGSYNGSPVVSFALHVATNGLIAITILHRLVLTTPEEIMPTATWNNQVIAEATACEIHRVEGNVYFPLSAVKREYLLLSDTHTTSPWKGIASYCDVMVDGQVNGDTSWYYPEPSSMAARIKDHVAWYGVKVEG
jgi:uncharacterized protein (DUF427 family)